MTCQLKKPEFFPKPWFLVTLATSAICLFAHLPISPQPPPLVQINATLHAAALDYPQRRGKTLDEKAVVDHGLSA
jgi:hypothetical protein